MSDSVYIQWLDLMCIDRLSAWQLLFYSIVQLLCLAVCRSPPMIFMLIQQAFNSDTLIPAASEQSWQCYGSEACVSDYITHLCADSTSLWSLSVVRWRLLWPFQMIGYLHERADNPWALAASCLDRSESIFTLILFHTTCLL